MANRGLDPTLGAILPLVGVLLGALAAGGVAYWLKRRDERGEFRAVARVLVDDLDSAAEYLAFIADTKRWSSLPGDAAATVSRDAWQRHELLIARQIKDDDDWNQVATAFRKGVVAGLIVAGGVENATKENTARDLITEMTAGAAVLRRHAYRDP